MHIVEHSGGNTMELLMILGWILLFIAVKIGIWVLIFKGIIAVIDELIAGYHSTKT